jgi:hypothetical protein
MAHCQNCGEFYVGTPIDWTTCEECSLDEELAILECWQDCGEFEREGEAERIVELKTRLAEIQRLKDEDELIARHHP